MNAIKETLEIYESMLPHGAKIKIANKAGVTRQAVSQFFAGKNRSKRIEDATIDIIAQYKQEREFRLRKAGLL